MVRSGALKKLLQSTNVEIRSVPATGDCFYECLHLSFQNSEYEIGNGSTTTCSEERPEEGGSGGRQVNCGPVQNTIQLLRDKVASRMTECIYSEMKMLALSGIEDYSYMLKLSSLDELQTAIRQSGYDIGPGKCIWADHFAIQTLSNALKVCFLILDQASLDPRPYTCIIPEHEEQQEETGTAEAVHEEAVKENGRDISLTNQQKVGVVKFCLLQRTRRQHFNPIFVEGRGLVLGSSLPESIVEKWMIPRHLLHQSSYQEHTESSVIEREKKEQQRGRSVDDYFHHKKKEAEGDDHHGGFGIVRDDHANNDVDESVRSRISIGHKKKKATEPISLDPQMTHVKRSRRPKQWKNK